MASVIGKVYFIGLGAPEPGGLRPRAETLLRGASLVVFGAEIERDWAEVLPTAAERLFTGQRGQVPPQTPEQILEAMRVAVMQGRAVVRLVPGDPLFQAGIETELMLCRNYGIPFEVIPGVPTSIAASVFAGIPLLSASVGPSLLVLHTPALIARESVGIPRRIGMPTVPSKAAQSEPRRGGIKVRRLGKKPLTSEERAKERESAAQIPLPPPLPPPPTDSPVATASWAELLKGPETLLFLQAGAYVDRILPNLKQSGRSSSEPVAVIIEPATPRQRTIVSTIGAFHSELSRQQMPPDSLLIVGDVVNLKELLDFRAQRRLQGLRVGLLGSPEELHVETDAVAAAGGIPAHFAIATTVPQTALGELVAGIVDDLRNCHYLVMADESAAAHFRTGLFDAELDLRVIPEFCQIIALGVETAGLLRASGLRVELVDTDLEGEGALLMKLPNSLLERRVLFIESTDSRQAILRDLRVRGAMVTSVPVYERRRDDGEFKRLEAALAAKEVDLLLVHSEEAARLLVEAWGPSRTRKALAATSIASTSPDATAFLEGAAIKVGTSANSISQIIATLEAQAVSNVTPYPAPVPQTSGVIPKPLTPNVVRTPTPIATKAPDESDW